jgi:hypothetical protein
LCDADLEISPPRISVRAHIRVLTPRWLDHPAGDLTQPADADLPDPNVRDRAGRAEIMLRMGIFEISLPSRLSGYATPAAIGTFGSGATC